MKRLKSASVGAKATRSDIFLAQVALSHIKVGKNDAGIAPNRLFWPSKKYDGIFSKELEIAIGAYQSLRGLKITGKVETSGPTLAALAKEAISLTGTVVAAFGVTTVLNYEKIKANAKIEIERIFLRAVMPNSDVNALGQLITELAEDGLEVTVDLKKLKINRADGTIELGYVLHGDRYGIVDGKWQGQWDYKKALEFLRASIAKNNIWKHKTGGSNTLILCRAYDFLKIGSKAASQAGIDFFGADSPARRIVDYFVEYKSRYQSDIRIKTIVDAAYLILAREPAISGEAASNGPQVGQITKTRKDKFLKLAEMMAQIDKELAKNLLLAFGGNRTGLKFRQIYSLYAAEAVIGGTIRGVAYLNLKFQFIMDPNDRKEYLLIESEMALGRRNAEADISVKRLRKSIADFRGLEVVPFANGRGIVDLGPVTMTLELNAQLPEPLSVEFGEAINLKNIFDLRKQLGEEGKNKNVISSTIVTVDIGVAKVTLDLKNQLKLDGRFDFRAGIRPYVFFALDTDIFDDVFYGLLVGEGPNFERIS